MSTVFLTGASRGIGRATALNLARRGSELALLGRASAELETTLSEIQKLGASARVYACELAEPLTIEAAVRDALSEFGSPAAVINNAGIIERAHIEATTLESWNRQLAVNLNAPFVITRALLPAMRSARRGRIVNVGSISSTLGSARAAAYCASKWGLVGFTKSLAEELRDSGLMTVAILPGSVDTQMLHGSGFEPRMSAEDVAKTIAYFALDAPVAHNGGVVEMFGT